MRGKLIRGAIWGGLAGLGLLFAAGAAAKPEVVQVGNLILTDNGGITPRKLPRHTQAPISAILEGHIQTADGTHPPALRSVDIEIDRTIELDARGLPSCRLGQLEASTTVTVKRVCKDAIVGSGTADVEVAFPEQAPFSATGPIVMFNGGVHGGKTLLFVHTYVAVPAPTAVVAKVQITRARRSRFGIRALAEIPPVAGGAGSATRFRLKVGRNFTYKGAPKSLLTASCPTGVYYTSGQAQFYDGTTLKVFHPLPCTPQG